MLSPGVYAKWNDIHGPFEMSIAQLSNCEYTLHFISIYVIDVEALDCRFIFTFITTLPRVKAPENMPEGKEFAKLDISLTWEHEASADSG